MAHYLVQSDITDSVVSQFWTKGDTRLEQWLTQVDNEINGLALDFGIQTASIRTPLHPRVHDYAVSYFCKIVCRDNVLINNSDNPDSDKYKVKTEIYTAESEHMEGKLTKDMFWLADGSIQQVDRISGGILVRM